MGLRAYWDSEDKDIIRAEWRGKWTMVDYRRMEQVVRTMITSVPHRVDGILDLHKMLYLPPGYGDTVMESGMEFTANFGIAVLVGSELLWSLTQDYYRHAPIILARYAYSPTVEGAYPIIRAHRMGSPSPTQIPDGHSLN